jgi:hypothetical protein
MEAVERLVRKSQAKIAEIDQKLAASSAESAAVTERIKEINRNFTLEQLRRLSDDQYVARLPPDLQALAKEHADAMEANKACSLDWGELSRERKMWERASSSDVVQQRYDKLRGRTPDDAAKARAAATEVDILGKPNTPENPLVADHIIPVTDIIAMDNFVLLPDDVALEILNMPENLEPVNRAANSSRNDRSWAAWPQWSKHADAATRTRMIDRETRLRQQIHERIQAAVARLMATR